MSNDHRNTPAMPAFRAVGVGSLVTRACMGCQRHVTTTGSTGSGIRWRCAACSPTRAVVAQT